MEYIAGEPLSARLGRDRLALPEALRVLRDVASGLAAAHAAGVIHRDLKPSNVLLAGDRAIVVDFGIAGENRTLAEGSQDIAGTRGYMAPEQMTGAPLDARVDVYAFGVLGFVLTTGRSPPLAPTDTVPSGGPAAVLPAAEVAPHLEDLPAGLAALIADCLAPPEGRPRDAAEVLRRLDAAKPRRGLGWQLPLLVVAVAAAAAIVVLATQGGDPPQDAPTAPRIVLPAVDATALPAQDRWLGPVVQRLLADELIKAWGLEVELGGPLLPAPHTLLATSQLARGPAGRFRLALDGTTLEAATARELAIAAAARLVNGHVPEAARHPTAADLAAVGAHDPEAWRLWRRAEHETVLMRFGRASELCRQALARDPEFPVASLELALTYSNNDAAGVQELAHAAELMDRALVRPLWQIALTGARRLKDGNVIGAALTAQELLGLDLTPRERLWIQLRWLTARLYLGMPPASVAPELVLLTERYPDHPAAFKLLADIYLNTDEPTAPISAGKLDEARARATTLADGSADRTNAELAVASAAHDAAGVLAVFARIEPLSTTPEHLFVAADALEHSGQPDQAATMYERLVDHINAWAEPIATTHAWSRLGYLREHAGDAAGARAAYAEVIRRWGNATTRIPEVDDARRRLRALRGR